MRVSRKAGQPLEIQQAVNAILMGTCDHNTGVVEELSGQMYKLTEIVSLILEALPESKQLDILNTAHFETWSKYKEGK